VAQKAWKTIYKQRSAVERVIAYLKEFFQLNNVRYRKGKRAKVHFDLTHLVYSGAKLTCDRLGQKMLGRFLRFLRLAKLKKQEFRPLLLNKIKNFLFFLCLLSLSLHFGLHP
jgi:hypothetical protein